MTHNSHFLSTVLNPTPPAQAGSTTNPAPGSSSTNPPAFTPTQQSLQARSKPYSSPTAEAEHYETRQRRHEAAAILENVELLMWFSMTRNESLAATRAHFTNISLGLEPPADSVIYKEEWELPESERMPSPRRHFSSSSSRTPRKSTGMPGPSSTTPKSGSKASRSSKHHQHPPHSPAAPDSPASFLMEQSDSDL